MKQLTANERRSPQSRCSLRCFASRILPPRRPWHSVTALPKRPVFILITSGNLFELLARLRREPAISQLRQMSRIYQWSVRVITRNKHRLFWFLNCLPWQPCEQSLIPGFQHLAIFEGWKDDETNKWRPWRHWVFILHLPRLQITLQPSTLRHWMIGCDLAHFTCTLGWSDFPAYLNAYFVMEICDSLT